MNSPENSGISKEKPVMKEALEFCDALQRAIGAAADFKRDPSHEHWTKLEDAQESIGRLSPRPRWGVDNSFQLRIAPSEQIDYHISKKWEILTHKPGPTIVDEVIAVRPDEVVFYRKEDMTYLVIFGHEMDIKPVLPDKFSEESTEAGAQ